MKRKKPPPLNTVGGGQPTVILDASARCKNAGGAVAPNGDCRLCGAANAEKCR